MLSLLGDEGDLVQHQKEVFRQRLQMSGVEIDAGMTWKVFRAFVWLLVEVGSRVNFDLIDTNIHNTGHRRKEAIERLDLVNGFYIVGAMNSVRVGHAFVLFVVEDVLMVADRTPFKPFAECGEWIERVVFVRKVELTN